MFRLTLFAILITPFLLPGCAGPAPTPEPGMTVIKHGYGEEMQVARDVDWGGYTKVILHAAPVAFRDNWKHDQERLRGKSIRDEDVERIRNGISGQFSKVMYNTLSERGGYEMTGESGPGTMVFIPNIIDLDVQAAGWIQDSILESLPESRGSMTIELVIRDSETDRLLGVAWQKQSDPRGGDMDSTLSVSNALAFRLMSQSWANWLLKQLETAGSAD